MISKNIKKVVSFLSKKGKETSGMVDDLLTNPKKERVGDEPKRYVHIGYPKSASTALQKGYLGRHNQLLHLGCGNRAKKNYWDDHGYISAEINKVVEVDLRYKNAFAYDADAVKGIFAKYFNQAKQDKMVHAVGLSNENFCFSWHGGVDVTEKARRLLDIFGYGTQIVMIIRNQIDLVNSLYKENVRFGYPGDFEDFIRYMWIYKDRNFTYEFCFEKVAQVYQDLFGVENVKILFFEQLKENGEQFLRILSEAIGIDYYNLKLDKEYNKQLSDKQLAIKRILNQRYPHTFGKGKFDVIDDHRYVPYYTDEVQVGIPDELYFDHRIRRYFNKLSAELSGLVDISPISLNWNSDNAVRLRNLFVESNQLFSERNPALRTDLERYKYLNFAI